jgi:hypothetical protein
MSIGSVGPMLLVAVLLTGAEAAAQPASEIRSGKWEFTTEMRMPAGVAAPGAQRQPGGSTKMTRMACITPANPVPATTEGNVECKIDRVHRYGGTVDWAMTCTPPQGAPVRSDGVAHYIGNAMEATFTAHLTAPNGQAVDSPGRITGHYQGPCDAR